MVRHRKPNQTAKEELKKRGITQAQASLDLGIQRTILNQIVNGFLKPNPDRRKAIAEYLGMEESILFDKI